MKVQPKRKEKSKAKTAKKDRVVNLAEVEVADDSEEVAAEVMELRDTTGEEGAVVEDHEARVKVMPER